MCGGICRAISHEVLALAGGVLSLNPACEGHQQYAGPGQLYHCRSGHDVPSGRPAACTQRVYITDRTSANIARATRLEAGWLTTVRESHSGSTPNLVRGRAVQQPAERPATRAPDKPASCACHPELFPAQSSLSAALPRLIVGIRSQQIRAFVKLGRPRTCCHPISHQSSFYVDCPRRGRGIRVQGSWLFSIPSLVLQAARGFRQLRAPRLCSFDCDQHFDVAMLTEAPPEPSRWLVSGIALGYGRILLLNLNGTWLLPGPTARPSWK